jgi:hypothetical protein
MRWFFFLFFLFPRLLPAQPPAEVPCDSSLQAYLTGWQQKLDDRFARMPQAPGPDLSATYELRLRVEMHGMQGVPTQFEPRSDTCRYPGEWETYPGTNLCPALAGPRGFRSEAGRCTIKAFGNRWLRVSLTDAYIGSNSRSFTELYYLERKF